MTCTSWPTKTRLTITVLIATFIIEAVGAQTPVGTAFTHQGRLIQAGLPADGDFDFEFRLFDAASAGNQQGSVVRG